MQIVFYKNVFLLKIKFFIYFGSFWCADLKNNFLKIKKIILMHFDTKSNHNHTSKQAN